MQKKLLLGLAAATLLTTMAPAFAASNTLNWGSQLDAAKCHAGSLPIINVVQNVTRNPDSGTGGNWALDNFTRQITVWQTGPGEFCAILAYHGMFGSSAFAGDPSPGGTGTLSGTEQGTLEGGFRATFSGTFTPGAAPTSGFIGSTDCGGTTTGSCTGYVSSWTPMYFNSGAGVDLSSGMNWWGWIYHGGSCGTWVDAVPSAGTGTGDIICP
ncbi:MAG: hypothetical protein KGI33_12000 [Thaumarchaeota archaeon]|nr:hypothetical protein [Nitrososphaerota archaeon]